MAEPAHGAGHAVSAEHPLAEALLVNPLANGARSVASAQVITRVEQEVTPKDRGIIR
jgi:hypothetical protein